MRIDLTTGKVEGSDSAISRRNNLSGSGPCAKKGVLKLQFGKPGSANQKIKVRTDMWFTNPYRWVFNVGDSPTNNGYGGDSRSTSRDAEIQGTGSTFAIYGNDYNYPKGGRILSRPGVIMDRFSVTIADGLVVWDNHGSELDSYNNSNLVFALKGQPDSEGRYPNYDIYFAMNRVVGTSYRWGTGLCHAAISWLE